MLMANRGKKNRFSDAEDSDVITAVSGETQYYKGRLTSLLKKTISLKAYNESQKKLIKSILNNEVTIISGRAGSGKTYCALAMALKLLKDHETPYEKIFMVKSVIPIRDEELGFLKGDLNEKLEPTIQSFIMNFEKIVTPTTLKLLREQEYVKAYPLAYVRGTSIDNTIICCDEIQNISLKNVKTLLTRLGRNSKIILMGDPTQIDMKNPNDSSLVKLIEIFANVPNIGVVVMDDNDENIRNPLITVMEDSINKYLKNGR